MQIPLKAGSPSPLLAAAGWRGRFLPPALVALVSVALYLPSLRNGFVFDDAGQIVANRWLTDVRFLPEIFTSGVWDFQARGMSNYYRPLMHVVYLATYQLAGIAPWAFHLVNVLLDAAVAVAAFHLARTLADRSDGPAPVLPGLLAGLLFALHPIHSEPVAWVGGLPDVAFTFFALLAILLHARQVQGGAAGGRRALAVAGAFFVACLFKETALVVLPLLAGYELLLARGDPWTPRVRRLAPIVLATGCYLALRLAALGTFAPKREGADLTAWEWALSVPVLFARYVGKVLLPVGLNAWHEFEAPASLVTPTGLGALLVTALVAAGLLAAIVEDRRVAFALLLFLLPLLPAFYLRAISGARFSERYLYLPSAGVSIAAGLLWARVATRPRVVMASLAAVALLGAGAAAVVRERIAVWHDDLSLWSDVVAKSPGIPDARYNLGVALMASGDRAGAMRQFQRALELRPKPVLESVSLEHLGLLYEEQGQVDVAIAHYEQAVHAWPDNPSANLDLGASLAQLRRFGEAVEHFRTALRIRPDDPRGHYDLGLAYVDEGQLEEGIRELETAVRLQPSDTGFRAELANAYAQRARVPRSPTAPGR